MSSDGRTVALLRPHISASLETAAVDTSAVLKLQPHSRYRDTTTTTTMTTTMTTTTSNSYNMTSARKGIEHTTSTVDIKHCIR